MTTKPVYLMDASEYMEAAGGYFAFDITPAFWERLIELESKGRAFSIDRVKEELERGNDALADWSKNDFSHGFRSTGDVAVVTAYRKVMDWVMQEKQYTDGAKSDFAKGADGWLVAYSMVHGCVLVTHEKVNNEVKKRIPIPNVCHHFKVKFCNIFDMLRELGIKFS